MARCEELEAILQAQFELEYAEPHEIQRPAGNGELTGYQGLIVKDSYWR